MIGEIAVALMLLSAAGLVVASFRKVMDAGLGFEPEHVLAVEVFLPRDRYPSSDGPRRIRFVDEVLSRMRALPGVQSAAATNFLPLSGFWGTTNFLKRGQVPANDSQMPEADNLVITPGYLSTMGIPLLRGRRFTADDGPGAVHVALINRKLARDAFGGTDPVGEELNLGSAQAPDWWRIVGVVGDVKAFGQDQAVHASVYTPFAQQPFPLIAFTLRTGPDPASLEAGAQGAIWEVDPNLAVLKEIPADALASQAVAVRRASSALIAVFALLALLLACVGIYGVMAYAVTQRTREIGVRMALGARRGDVLRMVLGMGARLTLAGGAIGLAGALVWARFLAALLFEVKATDPAIFLVAVLVLSAVSLGAAWFPARTASSLDPMEALRAE